MKAKDIIIFIWLILAIALVFIGIKLWGLTKYTPQEEEFLSVDTTANVIVDRSSKIEDVSYNTEEPEEVTPEVVEEPEVVPEEPEVIPEEPEEPEAPTGKQDQFAGNTDHGINANVSIDQKMTYNGREIYYYKNYRNNYVLTIKNGEEVNEIAEVISAAFTERVGNKLYYFKDMDGRHTFYSYDLVKKEEANMEIPMEINVVGMNSYDQKILFKVDGEDSLIEYNINNNTYNVVNN